MNPLINWNDLADLISKMPEEKRQLPVLIFNGCIGAYSGFIGISSTSINENPPDYPILKLDDGWFYINRNNLPSRSRGKSIPIDLEDDD